MTEVIQRWDPAFVHFKPDELKCPKSGGFAFHPGFAEKLEMLRATFAKPIFVNSCCRSAAYNATLELHAAKSLHVYDQPNRGAKGTCAVDVRIQDSHDRHELLKIGLALGFSCYLIGGNPVNIHMDQRLLLGEPVAFW